jgi:hypothetical protein
MTEIVYNRSGIPFDIDDIATDLNGKADVDLTNVNDSGTSRGAGWGMPSDKHIDMTLGASGSTYTAPANGWLCLVKATTSNNQYVQFNATEGNLGFRSNLLVGAETYSNGNLVYTYMPIAKGQSTKVYYNAGGAVYAFRFIYAVGSESEAQ